MSTSISIGRNVRRESDVPTVPEPMEERAWQGFIDAVADVPVEAGAEVYFSGEGEGTWEGVSEEAFTVIFEDVSDLERSVIVERLARLAEEYGQEAIALTQGTTEFVGPA